MNILLFYIYQFSLYILQTLQNFINLLQKKKIILDKKIIDEESPESHSSFYFNLPTRRTSTFCTRHLKTTESVNTFQNLQIIKALNKAKFEIYMAKSQLTNEDFAMKVFPPHGNVRNGYFQNEIRFSFLSHINIIKMHHFEPKRKMVIEGAPQEISYIAMEYAPYGDLFDFILTHKSKIDDKLIRTYFKQLIEAIEYLHNNGVSHLDIKLENLLIGQDYALKIADFDLSYLAGDPIVFSKGTRPYSAPEVIEQNCRNTQAADIYSMGIILFILKTRGQFPYAEDKISGGINFEYLMRNDIETFWNLHCNLRGEKQSYFEQDLKELFNLMTKLNPEQRATVKEIKRCRWYNGPSYSDEELKAQMKMILVESHTHNNF